MNEHTETPDAVGADILQFPSACAPPPPPPSLTDTQSSHWREILESLPLDWLNSMERTLLLSAYVRTISSSDFLATIMEKRQPGARFEDRHIYSIAEKALHGQTLCLMRLATQLGFTQQKLMRAEAAAVRSKRGSKGKRKPWDDGGR